MCKNRRYTNETVFYDVLYHLCELDIDDNRAYFNHTGEGHSNDIQIVNIEPYVVAVNSQSFVPDTTLSESGKPADAKAVGDRFAETESAISTITELLVDANLAPVITDDEGTIIAESDGTILLNL